MRPIPTRPPPHGAVKALAVEALTASAADGAGETESAEPAPLLDTIGWLKVEDVLRYTRIPPTPHLVQLNPWQ